MLRNAEGMLIDESPPGAFTSALAEATGQNRRHDPVLNRTGGPAGNAVLTAWTGLVLMVLSIGELLTLFDVRGLISWHIALGALLIPPALLKTATTGWRIGRYYLGDEPYRQSGPPPLLLRLLGPLVVLSTLSLLATGVLLLILGEQTSQAEVINLIGQRVTWVTLHQGAFVVWGVVTGLHLLGRIVPALRIITQRRVTKVPGWPIRITTLAIALASAAALALLLVHADGNWATAQILHFADSPSAA